MEEYTTTGIRLQPPDKEAIEAIKKRYGIGSNNGAIRFALRQIFTQIQAEAPQKKKKVSHS